MVSNLEANIEANIEAIARYFAQGESCEGQRKLGLEVEHFVVDAKTEQVIPYSAADAAKSGMLFEDAEGAGGTGGVEGTAGARGAGSAGATRGVGSAGARVGTGNAGGTEGTTAARVGVEDVLEALSDLYEGRSEAIDNEGKHRLIGLRRKGAPITIEPGAQLEVSMGPVCTIAELESRYTKFRSEIDPILEDMGCKLVSLGYHPSTCAKDIPLIPKHRYEMMDRHFSTTGKHGICMMRGSASAQVSIDFSSEADCMAKMKAATAIGPLIYFLCDNAPIFEGERVGSAGGKLGIKAASGLDIPKRMARTAIWDDVDADRSMVASCLFEKDAGYVSYAKMLMNRPPILTLRDPGDDSTAIFHGFSKASEIYADGLMSTSEIEHLLSMFFFDVRLKQYIEIRMADSMPAEYNLALAALFKGLFYYKDSFEELCKMTADATEQSIAQAKAALMEDAYDAVIGKWTCAEWLDSLISLADEGLKVLEPADESHYLKPLANLVSARTTLLDLQD